MVVLNFSHPLTPEQIRQIEALTGQPVEQVIAVDAQVDLLQPLAPQVAAMADRVGFSPEEWQTRPILVVLPALSSSAGVLLAELHGRMGYFPPIVRLRQAQGVVPPRFEVAEIISLQDVRTSARARRAS